MDAKKIMSQLQYPSTKRGVVMLVLGVTMIYQGFSGAGEVDFYALLEKVQRIVEHGFSILGFGLTVVGILGFLPDKPKGKASLSDRGNDAQILVDALGMDGSHDGVRRQDAAVLPSDSQPAAGDTEPGFCDR